VGIGGTRSGDSFLDFIMALMIKDKPASPLLPNLNWWSLLFLGKRPMVRVEINYLL
jgi:hypothetical protein